MYRKIHYFLAVFAVVFLASCKDEDEPPTTPPVNNGFVSVDLNGRTVQQLPAGTFAAKEYTMSADSVYMLSGLVLFESGAVLNIEPGTVILGDPNDERSALIMLPGSKIFAEGDSCNPIVFTSGKPVGERNNGDWGGVIICGNAPINEPAGFAEYEGLSGVRYGGTDPDDNSGVFKYVRIEFAGVPIVTNQEINGLTMAGVGRGTEINHVQVSFSGDDSFEWFGGSVNCSHLVAYAGLDEDFDVDLGYTGNVQFGVALRDPGRSTTASFGCETHNHPSGSSFEPYTTSTFSNISFIGPRDPNGTAQISEGLKAGLDIQLKSRQNLFNSVIVGWPIGLRLTSGTTIDDYVEDEIARLRNLSIAGYKAGTPFDTNQGDIEDFAPAAGIAEWMLSAGFNNDTLPDAASLQLNAPFNRTAPDFRPQVTSPLVGSADFTDAYLQNSFFTPVNYRGAFGPNSSWDGCWTNFDPQNTVY